MEQSTSLTEDGTDRTIKEVEYIYDFENVNWKDFLNYFCFLGNNSKIQREIYIKKQSDVDQEICDLMHYIELYDISDEEALMAVDQLKDARQRRRDIKDFLFILESFGRNLGTSKVMAAAKTCLKEIEGLDVRIYTPRKLPDIFKGMDSRVTDRDQYRRSQSSECEEDYEEYETEEEEMSYSQTIFDNKENDWMDFARQQMEFYQNICQYMINIRLQISEIDSEIEAVMKDMENTNYNASQGYKVFKELKALRTKKTELTNELETLRIMTDRFDCVAMADAYAGNYQDLKIMQVDATTEEAVAEEVEDVAV